MSARNPKRRLINPPATRAMYDRLHFSQATRVGDTIWVSGQVGIDAKMKPAEGMEAQALLAFQNLQSVPEAAGACLADVVELMTFHTDLRGDMSEFVSAKDQFFPDPYPAWSAVGVSQLAMAELRVEIRAVAVAGCGTQ